jgi:UDP-N-acetylglucosamine 1-carboxyvinyltransferase
MGAKISGAGSATIIIEGVEELHGVEHDIYNDRIEAGTYLVAAAITGGDVTVRGISPKHLPIFLENLAEAGVEISMGEDWIRARSTGHLKSVDASTAPFPGFATDLQPIYLTLMCLAEGRTVVQENLYDGRFGYVDELIRMGAQIEKKDGHTAVATGISHLTGADVESTDLRAGAALVLAGLAARGKTQISNIHYVDRGYESLVDKLRSLGAQITRKKVFTLPEEAPLETAPPLAKAG